MIAEDVTLSRQLSVRLQGAVDNDGTTYSEEIEEAENDHQNSGADDYAPYG